MKRAKSNKKMPASKSCSCENKMRIKVRYAKNLKREINVRACPEQVEGYTTRKIIRNFQISVSLQ